MSGGCVAGAGKFVRTRSALSGLWLPAPIPNGRDPGQPQDPKEADASERLYLSTPDGQALCAWRLVEPGHVTCTAFHCADAYGGLVHPSALIWGAEVWAWRQWPRARLTVRLRRSADVWPDAASFFVQAGWKEVGVDGAGRVLLERRGEP